MDVDCKIEQINSIDQIDIIDSSEQTIDTKKSTKKIQKTKHINDLPDVVLEYIFSLLTPYDELLNCRLVCKEWYNLTYSALHKIKLDFKLAIKNLNIEWNKYTTIDWPNISGRYSHSSCFHSKNMYIFGGCTTRSTTSNHLRTQSNMCTTFNDLWVFDLNGKTWNRPLMSGNYPPPKANASMVSHKNKLYLFGGWTHCSAYPLNQDWKLFDDLHEFNISNNKWTLIKPISNENNDCPPMAGHSASVIGNKMLVYGGLLYSQGSNFNPICINKDIYVYDFDTNGWTKKEIKNSDENPSPRYGHTQIVLDDYSLAVIGGCSSPKVLYNDIWILKMDSKEWYWRKVTIESSDFLSAPIIGFHQAVKVDNMVVFLSNICTNGKLPSSEPNNNRKLFRAEGNDNYSNQAGFSSMNMASSSNSPNDNQASEQYSNQSSSSASSSSNKPINHKNHLINNRLKAQPTQNERRKEFLASINKLQHNEQENSSELNSSVKTKILKSSTIKLRTIKNEHRLKPQNPMFLHVLDFSNVLTHYRASWLNQVRRYDGPDEIMLYNLIAATNQLIVFGGIEKIPINHHNLNTDRKLEIVSNSVYIASPKNFII